MTVMKKTILTVVGVAALGTGIGVAGLASADPAPTTSPSASASPTAGAPGAPGPRGGWPGRADHGARGDALAAELATKLGLDQTKVSDAVKALREANRPAKPRTKPTPGQAKPDPTARDAALAKALAPKLGVDEAKIKTALDEIRAAHQADRTAALKTRLATAVQDGKLTEAEADAVQKAVDQGVINVGPR